MGKILIRRNMGSTGVACKMICFINNEEVCRISENESFVVEKEKGRYQFTCKLTLGNPMSDKYEIDLENNEIVEINAKQGMWKPKAEIFVGGDTLTNEIRTIESKNKFNATNKVGTYFFIDEEKKQWAAPRGIFKAKIDKVYSYDDIIDFELIEDGNSISRGGIGKAIVGGLLFGGVGAIVGGSTGKRRGTSTCTMLKIKITIKDSKNPLVYINLISSEVKKESYIYRTSFELAQKIISLLQVMCDEISVNRNIDNNNNFEIDIPTEIKKYKELLDMGAITQGEFDEKKKYLLNL